MKTSVEPLEGNKVKLSIGIGDDEFETALNDAYRKIAREVRLPGFRPGKAPRRVLEARMGSGYARSQALQDAIPDAYARAIREHDVDAIAPPEIDITEGTEEGPIVFDAVVEIRPEILVAGYNGLRVEIDSPVPTDDEVEEAVERLRAQHSELSPVDRPAMDGDHVTVDIAGTIDGEEVDGLTADDYAYEITEEGAIPEIDENLRGAKPGDIFEFSAAHPDENVEDEIDFRILVKEVQERVLPDADDEFVAGFTEFATIEEFRASTRRDLRAQKVAGAEDQLRGKVAEALAQLVPDEPPEAMVDAEIQNRIQDLAMRLRSAGMEMEQYFQMTGQDPQKMVEDMREGATTAVKVDLALRAVALAEEIDVGDEEIDAEIAKLAEQFGQPAEAVREALEEGDRIGDIRIDVRKRLALDMLVESSEIVDHEGQPIDRADLVPDEDEEDGDEATEHDEALAVLDDGDTDDTTDTDDEDDADDKEQA
jgi:trigger factor